MRKWARHLEPCPPWQDGVNVGGDQQDGVNVGGDQQDGVNVGGDQQDGVNVGRDQQDGVNVGGDQQDGVNVGGDQQDGVNVGRDQQDGVNVGGDQQDGVNVGRDQQDGVNGLWREGGEGWKQVEPGEQAQLLAQLQEGEFWVEEEEFLREFDEVTISYPVTEAGHLQSLYTEKVLCHARALPGAWVAGRSAGGCRNNSCFPCNPKFWLRLAEPSEVCVAVLQKPREASLAVPQRPREPGTGPTRASHGQDYQAVGLHLWKVEQRRVSLPRVLSAPPVAGTACHTYDREVHLRCQLSPGFYLAVPSTFLKDRAGQFLLRVFSTGKVSLSAVRPVAKGASPRTAQPAGEWETVQLRGLWRAGQTAGGSRNFASYPCNPCLPFSVPEGAGPRCVRITLCQHCQLADSQLYPIGFHVFQVPSGAVSQDTRALLLQEPLLSCVPHRYAQEVSRLCLLSAGAYRVVPSTYLPDAEGAFTVTIAIRIDRPSIHSQEMLGQALQEVSLVAVMKT
ncbi:PREDICTED: calpain-10 [Dipodomys ordii]|uniref:Calpain-10 n=1 Tax=Dipodomys ordii TaxID=10020 RepID=A0A1S3GJY7_DIPOR|nr:PREDICTED: calpain-10 [Dipodomys ordii]